MSLLTSKPIHVELEITEHVVLANGMICRNEDHSKCDWKTIFQAGLLALYPEIKVSNPVADDKKIKFEISYTNRPARKVDVAEKLDQFFIYNPLMAIRSVRIN